MSSYQVQTTTHHAGSCSYEIRALLDRQQYSDPDCVAQDQGIGDANWSLFGVIWPSAQVLAEMLAGLPLRGRSFLEVGCGLGLPSLVLQQRGAQVTACDYHPLAQEFLDHNCELNGLLPIVFQLSDWSVHDPMLGRFDVLLASDTLYEQQHPTMLAAFFEQHAMPKCEIIVVDPGRGRVNLLTRLLEAQGYCTTNRRCSFGEEDSPPYRGQIVTYLRDTPLPSGPETTTST